MQTPVSGSVAYLPSSQGAVPLIINTDTRAQEQSKQWKGNHRKQRKKMSMPSPLCKLSSCPLLATNDLFVYLPVQILPDLVVAMERQDFTPAEVKGGYGHRPKEEGAEDRLLTCTVTMILPHWGVAAGHS